MARASMTLTDYSGEKTTFAVSVGALSGANFDTVNTAWTALRTAVQGITLGVTANQSLASAVNLSSALAASPLAQRENKWLITYVGNTSGKAYQVELGTAELDGGHLIPNSDLADLTHADWVAFISAFEAIVAAPDDLTEEVTVQSARFVGRNF